MYFVSLKIALILANSADSDEMQHNAAFHLGLHCVFTVCQSIRIGVSCIQRLKLSATLPPTPHPTKRHTFSRHYHMGQSSFSLQTVDNQQTKKKQTVISLVVQTTVRLLLYFVTQDTKVVGKQSATMALGRFQHATQKVNMTIRCNITHCSSFIFQHAYSSVKLV